MDTNLNLATVMFYINKDVNNTILYVFDINNLSEK